MQAANPLLNFFFPKKCLGCAKSGKYFCPECIKTIVQTNLVCPFCERFSIFGVTHPVCLRRFGLDGLWSLGVYQDPLRKAVQKLKYRWVKDIADELVDAMVEYWVRFQPFLLEEIKKSGGEGWVVIPVPLHWQRQNWRGFNQSALLALFFADRLGLKYSDSLVRLKNTTPQMKLLSQKRKQNIRGAFSFNGRLDGKSVVLVDDVWTTGSTLKECCFELKKAGAKKVWAVTVAR